MVPGNRRWRLIRRISNGVVAACAAAAVLVLCAVGYAGIPAVGRALDPGHGAWASASGGQLPQPAVLDATGIGGETLVSFDPHGIATIESRQLPDAMLALGYVHARFRLTQMDLARRLAEGRLSQLVGPSAVASDEFELRLGLLRTARREWAAMPKNSVAGRMLTSYAKGVNDYLDQLRASGQWPAEFSLAGVYPDRWSPVDSLAVQGYLAQQLDYTTSPLDYAVLAGSLGIGRTMRWFPVRAAGPGHPFDLGPYQARGLAPLAPAAVTAHRSRTPGAGAGAAAGGVGGVPALPRQVAQPSAALVRSAVAALAPTNSLPRGALSGQPLGSAWAVNGPRVRGGSSLLAGTAAAPGMFPAGWYQVAVTAPGYNVTGVSLPGMPGVLIGHNKRIAWTLTGSACQSALFYAEQTSRSHPGDYLWHGQWRPMRLVRYSIPVRGGATRRLTVALTEHGPLLTGTSPTDPSLTGPSLSGPSLTGPWLSGPSLSDRSLSGPSLATLSPAGPAISVDWTGSGGSPDVAVLARIGAAANFTQFHAALAGWRSPAATFVYADRRGNIGAATAGSFPVVRSGAPWLPLPGTGRSDVAGLIPFAALPVAYDPPGHIVAAAGQRPVGGAYPYYLGTSANDLDAADLAGTSYTVLGRRSELQPAAVVPLQTSPVSELAAHVVPRLLVALRHASLTSAERQAMSALHGWNYQMAPGSAAAAIWSAFWQDYVSATFGPWWRAASVPVSADPAGLQVSPAQTGLARALEQWTLAGTPNPVFTPPGAPGGSATAAMRRAFRAAVAQLTAQFHGGPAASAWRLDKLGTAPVVSSAQVPVVGYGRRAAAASPWLATAETGSGPAAPLAPFGAGGADWRMIVRLGRGPGGVTAEGIYPGGQSDNPASSWYANLTDRWQAGGYLPLPPAGTPVTGPRRWEFLP